MIRNRIKCHRRVRAGELVPHEWNFRTHPDLQRKALHALYEQVGFARSLLAYELPDGRLKLLDGHLRRDLTPDMEVDVEVLDITDEEARVLLLSLDPLAALAETQSELRARLEDLTPVDAPALKAAWSAAAQALLGDDRPTRYINNFPEQFLVLVTCRDERHQCEVLARFAAEGLQCKALVA